MTITIDLQPEVEQGLLALAQARGLSLTEYVQQIVLRETSPATPSGATGQDLIDASAHVRGLFTDEEIDTLFARNPSASRAIELESTAFC